MTSPKDKVLKTSDALLDSQQIPIIDKFCAPLFIGNQSFGITLNMSYLDLSDDDERNIRSGTVSFVKFKGEYFALTCAHVLNSLKERQTEYQNSYLRKDVDVPNTITGYEFYTVRPKQGVHFCYEFTAVETDCYDEDVDIAIARINYDFIKSLGKEAISIIDRPSSLSTGLAVGFPEEGRRFVNEGGQTLFGTNPVYSVASLVEGKYGGLQLFDEVSAHNGANNLSGISGGPVIWSVGDDFGLAGIVKKGAPIQPTKDRAVQANEINIECESILSSSFENWIRKVPPITKIKPLIPNVKIVRRV